MKAMNQLQSQNVDRLQNSRRQLSDIENVGSDIMIDLRRQRDVLIHSKDNLEETDNWINSSSRVLRSMAQHTMCMSALWWLIVLFLLLIIVVIVYVKWLRPK
jgi:vesicle transport through interaction with t-SNAREs protein 1